MTVFSFIFLISETTLLIIVIFIFYCRFCLTD
uniref:Uncharacterized protein n=1 Tax=Anguilla anguilla TaxID=7936 RepID=A0A0E9T421_ANGAN